MTNESLKITIPLRDYVEVCIGYKEFSVIDTQLGLLIKSIDILESICHIEMPGDNDNKQVMAKLWRRQEWETNYSTWLKKKEESEKARQGWLKRKETIDNLCKAILNKLPMLDATQTVLPMATKIVDNNNKEAANQFGIVLE